MSARPSTVVRLGLRPYAAPVTVRPGTMNFASVTFLFFFLPAVVALYFVLRGRTVRNAVLLVASLLFYAWGEGAGLALLLVSITINHLVSRRIAQRPEDAKPVWLWVGLSANIGLLITFKYLGLITTTLGLPRLEPRLPLGISFFTFQAMSLLVDVHRGASPARSWFKTGLFISLFPQLIAGPIVRWNTLRDQITARRESFERFTFGARLFVLGLAQKVLIADTLAPVADAAFDGNAAILSTGSAWAGLIAFTLQIYYDFAGYSNMAIGLGAVFGFTLPRNFEHPYSAASFREFWRRWHITLSRWFRDYLYIPLGGSKEGALKTYRNLLIVFVLCGLWHGAAWTFLLWGLWHGAFLVGERFASKAVPIKIPRGVGVLYTVLFVALGWVLFRAESAPQAWDYWGALWPFSSGVRQVEIPVSAYYAFAVGALLAWDGWLNWIRRNDGKLSTSQSLRSVTEWGLIAILTGLCFAVVASTTHQPFLYFRF